MKIVILNVGNGGRVEVIDVEDHLVNGDIEGFLTKEGYSLNNISWMQVNSANFPMKYHHYCANTEKGDMEHFLRVEAVGYMTIDQQVKALQRREQAELKEAILNYGEQVDGGYEIHLHADFPVVAGYDYYRPTDIKIMAARTDAEGHLSLIGVDNDTLDDPHAINPDDIFGGQLDFVTSTIMAMEK